jgi:hypothetical protein
MSEIEECLEKRNDNPKNNEERELCHKINENFSKFKEKLEKFSEIGELNNNYQWQTTPIIGYQETVYKKGGAVIIGYNENSGSKIYIKKCNINGDDKDNDFTGEKRDCVLNNYRYFKFFTGDSDSILKEKYGKNIKFLEFIPIKTSGKGVLLRIVNKNERIQNECFENLMSLLHLIEPDLVICNDLTVSGLFYKKYKEENKNLKEPISSIIFDINGRRVPVVLSGQINSRNGLDRYNEIRYWREIEKILGG